MKYIKITNFDGNKGYREGSNFPLSAIAVDNFTYLLHDEGAASEDYIYGANGEFIFNRVYGVKGPDEEKEEFIARIITDSGLLRKISGAYNKEIENTANLLS